jgi:hypothetical protein
LYDIREKEYASIQNHSLVVSKNLNQVFATSLEESKISPSKKNSDPALEYSTKGFKNKVAKLKRYSDFNVKGRNLVSF